jgi:uncharacterized Zn-binding protein involved in type VI secretion
MSGAARINDVCSGHDNFPSRPNDSGSANVFIDSKPAHRVGDHWMTHTDGDTEHDGILVSGSPNVFVNGRALGRVGDAVSCGSIIVSGSSTVFVN